jgi:hypothetical protein
VASISTASASPTPNSLRKLTSAVPKAMNVIVSERTVKSHISAIFTKLGVRDRAGAIVIAYEAGATDPT